MNIVNIYGNIFSIPMDIHWLFVYGFHSPNNILNLQCSLHKKSLIQCLFEHPIHNTLYPLMFMDMEINTLYLMPCNSILKLLLVNQLVVIILLLE